MTSTQKANFLIDEFGKESAATHCEILINEYCFLLKVMAVINEQNITILKAQIRYYEQILTQIK